METGLHYVDGRETIDSVAIERLVGAARVLDLTGVEGKKIEPDHLRAAGYEGPERVLLKTTNSAAAIREAEKRESWVGLGTAAAQLLVALGTKLVGINYLSVETPAAKAARLAGPHATLRRGSCCWNPSTSTASRAATTCSPACPEAGARRGAPAPSS